MMEENPETVLLAVDTNFDTNLVVIPPRSATIADVLEKIKQGHMALYPSYGNINILSVKVEMFNRLYLLEESHKVGQIFRGWQGCLHVEVADYRPSSPTASKLRLPLISAGDEAQVSPCMIGKHPLPGGEEQGDKLGNSSGKGPPPILVQPEISLPGRHVSEPSPNRIVASQAVEVNGSQKSPDGRNSSERLFGTGSQNVVLHRQTRADGQGMETVEAGLDMALDALLDEGPANVGRSRDSDGRIVANKDTFGGTQASPQSSPRKSLRPKAQFSGDSRLSGERKRKAGELLALTGPQDVRAEPADSLDLQQCGGSAPPKKNRIRGKSDTKPVKIERSPVKAVPDIGQKIVDDKKIDVDVSSSESGPDSAVREEARGSSRQGPRAKLLSGAESSKVRVTDSITHGKTAEKDVILAGLVGKPQPMLRHGRMRSHSSGSSSSESSEKGEVKELVKAPESGPVLKHGAQDESSGESSSSGDSSKSYRPDGGAGTRDVDEVVKNLVNLYSPIISDDSAREQSSDASEERQPKGLRIRMNSSAVGEADNTAERNSRRGSRTTSSLDKFQHFIDSQDGLDQLLGLTLSQRKSKPGIKPEPQVPAIQRGALALDSLSIDVVPDTQVGNIDASAQREVYNEEIMHTEKTTGEGSKDAAVKRVQGGSPNIRSNGKDERKSSESKSKGTGLSADTNEDPSESLKNFASIASESARKFDSNEDLLQPKSDDSQRFQAAVQLTRLGMADEEDDAGSDPMQSPKDSSVEKKKKKKRTKVKPDTSVAVSRENDLPDDVGNSAGIDPPRRGLATASSDPKKDSPPLLPTEHPLQEVGVERAGTDLSSTRNMLGVGEKSINHSLEKDEEEVNAVMDAIATSATKLQEGNTEPQVEEGKVTEAAPVVEDSESLDRDQDRSDVATPGKVLQKKKLSARRSREERIVREKETELNISEGGRGRRGEEPTVTAKKTEDVPYVEDSPVKDGRAVAEGQGEPSTFREGRPEEKSGRKKKAKKGTRPADSPDNEKGDERSSRSLFGENGEWTNRSSEKKQSVLGRLEAEQVGAGDGLGLNKETGAVNTPGKRKKKKPRADSESRSFGSEFANAHEARGELMRVTSSSILSSHPCSADGGLTHEPLTSGPRAESFALPEGNSQPLADEETPVMRPVSKKKKKAKTASSLEPTTDVTDAEVEIGRKEFRQATSDVEAVIPVLDLGHTKPPRPGKKKGPKHMELLSTSAEKASLLTRDEVEVVQSEHPGRYTVETHSKELKRRRFSDDLDADLDSKDGILTSKAAVSINEEPSKKVTSPGNGPPIESFKKKKKKKTPGGTEGDIPLVVLDMNSSPSREDRFGMDENTMYVGALDSIRGDKTGTPKRKKKKPTATLSVAEGENDEALEPSCNQLGYRGSGRSELSRDVDRNATVVDHVFIEERSTEEHTKTKKKRAKSLTSDLEKPVRASSPISEYPGSRTPKPKKRKHLTNPEHNVDAGATIKKPLRGADGKFVTSEIILPEEAARCPFPGCEKILAEGKPSSFRHMKFCEFRPDGLPVPEPNKLNRKKRRKAL